MSCRPAPQLLFLLMRVRKLIKAKGILIFIIADTSVLSGVYLEFLYIYPVRSHRVLDQERLFVFLSQPCLAL